MATTTVYVSKGSPSCLLHVWEAIQDQLVVLIQAPFKLMLLHWDLEFMGFCMCLLNVESLFSTALLISHTPAPLSVKARHPGGSYIWCSILGLRSLMLGSNPSLFGENLCDHDYLPFCGSTTQGSGSWVYHISTPPTCFVLVPSLYF